MKKCETLVPLAGKVVVRREEAEEKKGNILLPDVAKEKPRRGRVVAVGQGRLLDCGQREEMEVRDGDTILFRDYRGAEVEIGDETLLVLTQDDILAIFHE